MQRNQYNELVRLQRSLPSMDHLKESYDSLQAKKRAFAMAVSDVAYESEKDIVRLLQERTGIKNIRLVKTSQKDEKTFLKQDCRCILVYAEGFDRPFLGIRGTVMLPQGDDVFRKSNLADDIRLALDGNYNTWNVVKGTEKFIADAIREGIISASAPVYVAGHSLAGAVAKVISAKHDGYESFSFDSPELGPNGVRNLKQERFFDQSKMYTCQFTWNKINTCWPNQLGTVDRIILSPETRADFVSKGFGYVKYPDGTIAHVLGEFSEVNPREVSTTSLALAIPMHSISDNLAALSSGKAYLIRERNHSDSASTTISDTYMSSLPGIRAFLEARSAGFATKEQAVASAQLDSAYANLSQTIQDQSNQTVEAFHSAEKRVVDKTLVLENGTMTTREVLDAIFEGTMRSELSPTVQAEKIEDFIHTKEKEARAPTSTDPAKMEADIPSISLQIPNATSIEPPKPRSTFKAGFNPKGEPAFIWQIPSENSDNEIGISIAGAARFIRDQWNWRRLSPKQKEIHTLCGVIHENTDIEATLSQIHSSSLDKSEKILLKTIALTHRYDLLPSVLSVYSRHPEKSVYVDALKSKLSLMQSSLLQWASESSTSHEDIDRDMSLSHEARKEAHEYVNIRQALRSNNPEELLKFYVSHTPINRPEEMTSVIQQMITNESVQPSLVKEYKTHDNRNLVISQFASLLSKKDALAIDNFAQQHSKTYPEIKQMYIRHYIGSNVQLSAAPVQAMQGNTVYIHLENAGKPNETLSYQLINKKGKPVTGILSAANCSQYASIKTKIKAGETSVTFSTDEINAILNASSNHGKHHTFSTRNSDKLVSILLNEGSAESLTSAYQLCLLDQRTADINNIANIALRNHPRSMVAQHYIGTQLEEISRLMHEKSFDEASRQISLLTKDSDVARLLCHKHLMNICSQHKKSDLGVKILRDFLSETKSPHEHQEIETTLMNFLASNLHLATQHDFEVALQNQKATSHLSTEAMDARKALINNEIVRLNEARQFQNAAELCDKFISTLNSDEEILKYTYYMTDFYIQENLSEEAIVKLTIHLEKVKPGSDVHQKIADLLENTVSLVHIEPIKEALRKFDLGKVLLLEQGLEGTAHEKAKQFCAESRSLLTHYYTALVVDGLSGFASQYARAIKDDQDRFAAMVTLGTLQVGGKIWTELNRFWINIKNDTDFSGGNLLRNPGTFYLVAAVLNTVKQYHAGIVKAKGNELGYAGIDLGATLFDSVGLGFDVAYLLQQQEQLEKITDRFKLLEAQWQWNLQAVGTGIHATRVLLDFVITADDIYEWYNPGASFKLRDEKYIIPLTKIGLQSAPNFVSALGSTGIDFCLYSGAGLVQLIGGLAEYLEPTDQDLIKRGEYLPDEDYVSVNGALKATRKALTGLSPAKWLAATVNVPVAIGSATAGWLYLYANTQTDINTLNTYINSMIAANGYVFKVAPSTEIIESKTLYFSLNNPEKPPEIPKKDDYRVYFQNATNADTFERLQFSCQLPNGEIIENQILTLDDFTAYNFINPVNAISLLSSKSLSIPIGGDKSLVIEDLFPDLVISLNPLDYIPDLPFIPTPWKSSLERFSETADAYQNTRREAKVLSKKQYLTIACKLYKNIPLTQQEITQIMRIISIKKYCALTLRDYTLASEKILCYMQRTSKTAETDLQETYNSFRMSSLQSEINALMKNAQEEAAIGRHWEASQLYASLASILSFNPRLANHCNRMRYFSLFRLAFDNGYLEQAENYLLVIQKLDFTEHSLSHNFCPMSKIEEESDKKPQPGSIYFRLENNKLFYRTCFSYKEKEIFKNDLVAAGMNDQIKIPAGSDLCDVLISYKDVILKVILRKGDTHLNEENELVFLRDLLQVYIAQSDEYFKESKEEKYKITIKKAKETYIAIKNLLKKMPEEEHKPLRAFIESQKENKIFSQAPGDEEVANAALGLVSVISLAHRLFKTGGRYSETNYAQLTAPISSYSSYMRIISCMFRPTYQTRKSTSNFYTHSSPFQQYKPFAGRKTGVLGLSIGVAGTLFYAGCQAYRMSNAELKPMGPGK